MLSTGLLCLNRSVTLSLHHVRMPWALNGWVILSRCTKYQPYSASTHDYACPVPLTAVPWHTGVSCTNRQMDLQSAQMICVSRQTGKCYCDTQRKSREHAQHPVYDYILVLTKAVIASSAGLSTHTVQ